ncbi:MAG: cobalt-precorrin 5A hydrolase [Bilifractor sp.]
MKIAGICFTRSGGEVSKRIIQVLQDYDDTENGERPEIDWYGKGKYLEGTNFKELSVPVQEWAGKCFEICDTIIFVGAAGIAVRAIAPYVRDKRTDPAVIVVDEKGKFCISLLSGHIGGANEMVENLAAGLGSVPVITTATDVSHKFAVDVYAEKNNMVISNMTYAKEVSAALLAGEPVGFYTNFPVEGDLPEGIYWSDKLDAARALSAENEAEGTSLGIYISPSYNRQYFDHTLWLIPKCLVLGIGCKKGTPAFQIQKLVDDTLRQYSLYPEAVASVASIDLKKDEPGLLQFCRTLFVPLHTFSTEELNAVQGNFTKSEFVKKTTGTDNVCERSAVCDGGGNLIIRKVSDDGVTLAVALLNRKLRIR